MCRFCTAIFWSLTLLYLIALAVLIIGTFGLFGADRDPLSAVFVVILGMPWTLLIDAFPEPYWPWLQAAAPGISLILLWLLRRRLC